MNFEKYGFMVWLFAEPQLFSISLTGTGTGNTTISISGIVDFEQHAVF
jgi:hypothetical protein